MIFRFKAAKHLKVMRADKLWKHSMGGGVKVFVMGSGYTPHQNSGTVIDLPPVAPVSDTLDHRGHEAPAISLINGQPKGSKWVGFAPQAIVYSLKAQTFSHHPVSNTDVQPFSYAGLKAALDWFDAGNKFHILNCSWNIPVAEPRGVELIQKLNSRGVIIIISGNNFGQDTPQPYAHLKDYVISIGATDFKGNILPWSNRGCDFYVPGQSILAYSWMDYKQYVLVNGTSFSAPSISGMMATLVDKFHEWTTNNNQNAKEVLGTHCEKIKWSPIDDGKRTTL